MVKIGTNRLGVAAELRVMSELLLRGHNPAKSYLEDGADLFLENGLKAEVKSAHTNQSLRKDRPSGKGWRKPVYYFSFRGGHRKQRQGLNGCDFVILWAIDDNDFYIIPKEKFPKHGILIPTASKTTKWLEFKNNWEVLDRR